MWNITFSSVSAGSVHWPWKREGIVPTRKGRERPLESIVSGVYYGSLLGCQLKGDQGGEHSEKNQ